MNENRYKRKSFLWNAFGGGLVAFQSAALLFLAARFYDQETAGVVSIAYALAVFVYSIGRYGMRSFQATDVLYQYSFRDYFKSRIISLLLAIVLLLCYLVLSVLWNGYSPEKCILVFEIVFLRLVNAFEDVFCGHLQRMDRFLEGARIMAIREGATLCVIMLLMVLRVDLILAFLLAILLSIAAEGFLLGRKKSCFSEEGPRGTDKSRALLQECFPLALSTAFAVYLSNVPKYVTDWYLDDTMQAIVGYLILPVFTIALLNQFIFNPFIRELGELYHEGDRKRFRAKIVKQTGVILGTSAVIGILTVIVGLPLLSFLFKADLKVYRTETILFLIGGCLYTIQYYLTIPLTVMKKQKSMLYGFLATIAVTTLIQKRAVWSMGLRGVALVYLAANLIMDLYMALIFLSAYLKGRKKSGSGRLSS